jgi:hypothetical protein
MHQLNGIIADYLGSVERGDVPDRAALLARYAEFAKELSAFFADNDRFLRVAGPLAEALTLPPGESPAVGMRVVYKARQISLNRPIALKLILGAGFFKSGSRIA